MLRLSQVILLIIILMGSIAFSGCTYNNEEDHLCSAIPDPVSFNADILPILRTNCSTLLCHSGSVPAANMNLEDEYAYAALSKPGKGYINTAMPNHSILYVQLNSLSLPMPPDGKLDPCTISLILKWIEQGAKNN